MVFDMAEARSSRDDTLRGLFAKTKRANAQIEDLEQRIDAFFKSGPHDIVSKLSRDGTQEVWSFRLNQKLPDDIPVIIGEILHNLRSPLDQILCAIALKHSGSQDGVAFPRGRNREEFRRALSKQEKLLPPDAIKLIAKSKPYRDRGTTSLGAAGDESARQAQGRSYPSATTRRAKRLLPLLLGRSRPRRRK